MSLRSIIRDIYTGMMIQTQMQYPYFGGAVFSAPLYQQPCIVNIVPSDNFFINSTPLQQSGYTMDFNIDSTGVFQNGDVSLFNSGQSVNLNNLNNSLIIDNNFINPPQQSFNYSKFDFPDFGNYTIQNTSYNFGSDIFIKQPSAKQETVRPPSGKHDLNWWKDQGYDEEMGRKLGADAKQHAKHDPHQCSAYTRRTLNRLYGTNFDNGGPAYLFGENILSDPKLKGKFKKINVTGLKNGEFPEGAIIIWKPGAPGYTKGKAALYGHVAIAHNNRGYSNGAVNNLSTYYEVWIPVKS